MKAAACGKGIPADWCTCRRRTRPSGDFQHQRSRSRRHRSNDQFVADALNATDGTPRCRAAISTRRRRHCRLRGVAWSDIFPERRQIPTAVHGSGGGRICCSSFPTANAGRQSHIRRVPTEVGQSRTSSPSASTTGSMIIRTSASTTTSPTTPTTRRSTTFKQSGANVPGFGNIVNTRFQQWNLEPHLDHQQLPGQRIPLHLHARRPADIPAPAEHGCW